MIYEAMDIWNSPYIEHHGVKGMKWGVRHDTRSLGRRISGVYRNISNSYLDSRINSAKRKKDMFNKSYDNTINKERAKKTKFGRRFLNVAETYKRGSNKYYDKEINRAVSKKASFNKEMDSVDKNGLSTKQKIAIGVGIASVAVSAAVVAYSMKKYGATSVRKLPKMNIMRGKSTVRSIDLNEEYRTAIRNTQTQDKLRDYVRSNIVFSDYSARYNPQLRSKLGAATENYARTHNGRSNLWSYRPVYTTNSGNRITKRLGRR